MPNEPVAQADQAPRPSPRIDVHEEARLIDIKKMIHDVVLRDVSRDGFRINCDGTLIRPGFATLQIQRYGGMPVQILWSRGDEAGGIFLDPVPEVS